MLIQTNKIYLNSEQIKTARNNILGPHFFYSQATYQVLQRGKRKMDEQKKRDEGKTGVVRVHPSWSLILAHVPWQLM